MATKLPATCAICRTPIGELNPDGVVETPAILPCGHIFGNQCITKWVGFEGDELSLDKDNHDTRNCPYCRRRLVYTDCGHTMLPKLLPVLITKTITGELIEVPVQIIKNELETPSLCFKCMMLDLPLYRGYQVFRSNTHHLSKFCAWVETQSLPAEILAGRSITNCILKKWQADLEIRQKEMIYENKEYVKARGPEKW